MPLTTTISSTPVSPLKTFYIVETYTAESMEITRHRNGWKYEVFDCKDKIPELYFLQDEIHAFFKYKASDEEMAVRRFKADLARKWPKGLLWTYGRDKM